MQLQNLILSLLAATATPIIATPLSLDFTSLQPRTLQSEICQQMNLTLSAVIGQLDEDCDAECEDSSTKALDILKSAAAKFLCKG